jgi:membrane-associated phospholipid phosphatase
MTNETPPRTLARSLACWLVVAIGLLFCTLLDPWAYQTLATDPDRQLLRYDWFQCLRQAGNLLPWAMFAGCLVLHDLKLLRAKQAVGEVTPGLLHKARSMFLHRGSMVFFAPAVGGLVAELLKGALQRGRPVGLGVYRFGYVEEVSAFGLASSHAGVAFGAAFMVGRLFPGSLLPLFALACGTAFSRVIPGAHYLSDVYVGAVVGWLATDLLWRTLGGAPGGARHRLSFISTLARQHA